MGGQPTNQYPEWKKYLWNFVRGLVAGGVSNLFLAVDITDPKRALQLVQDPKVLGSALLTGFIVGVIVALGKWLRNNFGNDDQNAVADKLPF